MKIYVFFFCFFCNSLLIYLYLCRRNGDFPDSTFPFAHEVEVWYPQAERTRQQPDGKHCL